MYALIQWTMDGLHSIIRLRAILKPRKEETDYAEGEKIRATWQGTELEATIVLINDDRTKLNAKLGSVTGPLTVTNIVEEESAHGSVVNVAPPQKAKNNIKSKQQGNTINAALALSEKSKQKSKQQAKKKVDDVSAAARAQKLLSQRLLKDRHQTPAKRLFQEVPRSRPRSTSPVSGSMRPSRCSPRKLLSSPTPRSDSSRSPSPSILNIARKDRCITHLRRSPRKCHASCTPSDSSISPLRRIPPIASTSSKQDRRISHLSRSPRKRHESSASDSSITPVHRSSNRPRSTLPSDEGSRFVTVDTFRRVLKEVTMGRHEKAELEDEIAKLRRRISKLEKCFKSKSVASTATDETLYNGHTREELSAIIWNADSEFSAAYKLLLALFTKEYLLSHSVTGKAANSRVTAKDRYDKERYEIFQTIMKEKYNLSNPKITVKVHSVQHALLKELDSSHNNVQ